MCLASRWENCIKWFRKKKLLTERQRKIYSKKRINIYIAASNVSKWAKKK